MLLFIIAMSLIVWILTPPRLTPIANRYAGEFLNADVKADRVELTFWSSFPKLTVDIDRLDIISKSLNSLPSPIRASLPTDADSLLTLEHLHAGINVLELAIGKISLYDVELRNPGLNLLVVNDSTTNFNILPPSAEAPDSTSGTMVMPAIALDRFAIAGSFPIRFRSIPDSIDATLTFAESELTGHDNPMYRLSVSGSAGNKLLPVHIPDTPFGINGNIKWDCADPMKVELSDFTVSLRDVKAGFNASIDMTDSLMVPKLDVSIPKLRLTDAIALIPDSYRGDLGNIHSDMTVDVQAELLHPYAPGGKSLPELKARLKLNASEIKYQQLDLQKLKADIEAVCRGTDLDASTVTIHTLEASGRAIDFTLSGNVTHPISDPAIKGIFDGSVAIGRLPSQLLSRLPFTIEGTLNGHADFSLRQSYLTPKKFHKAHINGKISLSEFNLAMADSSMQSYIRQAVLSLGTDSKVTVNGQTVDSLLTASLSVDTIAVGAPGVSISGRDMTLSLGSRNVSSSSDTTQINPLGITIKAGRLNMLSDSDHVHFRLRDAGINATLQRYNSQARSPLLKVRLGARNIRYADKYNRASMRNSQANLTLHPRARRPMPPALQARYDSIAAAHPELSGDTIMAMAMRHRKHNISDTGRENLTFGIDNSLRSWLRLWQAEGTFKTERVRVFTPYFPTRNTLSDVDLSFSTDSIVLRDTRYRMGHSDFTLNGSIRNISRALTSRRGAPLELNFDMNSDTIDINDITATLIRGAAFAEKQRNGTAKAISEYASDEHLQNAIDHQAATADTSAFIVPSNIQANMRVNARRVLYNDIWLKRFSGEISVYDGAINLQKLRGRTDIGSVNLTALYSAPTKEEMKFAAGMRINKLDLHEFMRMMPQFDSIMPLLKEIDGIVNADLALTTDLDEAMNLKLNTIDLALKLTGDSLVLLDSETFRTVAKWMMFKHKDRNMIDHMEVEMTVHEGWLDLYPFIFDMDRYRLGVRGSNDMNLNLDYHVAVLKSPIPFKFGINIKGTPEKMKIRLGKARINEKNVASSRQITDTVRINLMNEMNRLFKRGVRTAGTKGLKMQNSRMRRDRNNDAASDTLSHADSVMLIKTGVMDMPPGFIMPADSTAVRQNPAGKSKSKKKR